MTRRTNQPVPKLRAPSIGAREIALATWQGAPDAVRLAVERQGRELLSETGDLERIGKTFRDVVLTLQPDRPRGMPLPILPGIIEQYGVSMASFRRAVDSEEDARQDYRWLVTVGAFQAAAAWLIDDWLRNATYPELITARRWVTVLRWRPLSERIRANPCIFEQGIKTGWVPWGQQVFVPAVQERVRAVTRAVVDALTVSSAQVLPVANAWFFEQFYERTVREWHQDVQNRLQGRVRTVESVVPAVTAPRTTQPTPRQQQHAQQHRFTPAPSPTEARTTPVPTGAPSAYASWKQVPPEKYTLEQWVRQAANAGLKSPVGMRKPVALWAKEQYERAFPNAEKHRQDRWQQWVHLIPREQAPGHTATHPRVTRPREPREPRERERERPRTTRVPLAPPTPAPPPRVVDIVPAPIADLPLPAPEPVGV